MSKPYDQPLVSIVTPTYNREKFIIETVDSMLAQTYQNIEYIVINDGSTDNTLEILEKYKEKIKIESHANIGQVRTLNKAWKNCNGKYIGYLSSDDLLYPNAIAELVAQIEKDESIVCVFPDSELIDEFSHVLKKNVCRPFNLPETLITQECYIGPGAIFRKDAFDMVGGWREDLLLGPDREFWIRLSSLGSIDMCQLVLARYRTHPDSGVVKEVTEEVGKEYLRVLDDYFAGINIPFDLQKRKSESYGYAYLLLSRNSFKAGDFKRGIHFYSTACVHHAPLKNFRFKLRLVRNVISRPVRRILSYFQIFSGYGRRI
jgi:glycosyltransferase involved in cell wall biosynthesis